MSRLEDESNTNTLPDPELNPMLNPLLAAHMGRWAEVYFTNPPEKRGAAIAELIRELESTSPPPTVPVPAARQENAKEIAETASVLDVSQPGEYLSTCRVCAYENSAGQFYCGMCGVSLKLVPEEATPEVAEVAARAAESTSKPESREGTQIESAIEPPHGSRANATEPATAWASDASSLGIEPAPVTNRYRLYVGAALAVLLLVLVYTAWRGTKANLSATGQPSAPSITPTTLPAPAEMAPQRTAPPSISSESNASPSQAPSKQQPAVQEPEKETAGAKAPSRVVAIAESSSSSAGEPGGAEDLATAEKYLNGTHGASRDSKEAAQWLWKAVGKGNLAAATVLSDLYLRGDGVSKSCDQARLLLDAAARKGSRAAAERLSNLQAFGCQ